MRHVKKILELVNNIGTSSFHSLIGELILAETKSNKLLILRYYDGLFAVLDAQNIIPQKLEYSDIEEILSETGFLNMYEFSFGTFILCDGEITDIEIIDLINGSFDKEKDFFEKDRLMTVVDRISYQLSSIESLVLSLSEPLTEESFIDIVQSSLSELLFSGITTYRVNKFIGTKISEIGFNTVKKDEIELNEVILSCLEMQMPLIDENHDISYIDEKVKVVIPIGDNNSQNFLFMVLRDTKIEEEEKLFVSTIFRIIQHFYIKQFIELVDFKEQLSVKTLNILHIFDNIIYMIKDPEEFEKKLKATVGSLAEIHNIFPIEGYCVMPSGVYTKNEVNSTEYDIVMVYPDEMSDKRKSIGINLNSEFNGNYLELTNILSLVLEGYESILDKKKWLNEKYK